MLNNKNRKQIFYEVNPLFFYDSNNDGFGDFQGISKKMDYFSFMDVDCVIIPDVFNNHNTLLFGGFINLKSKYGNMNDLKEMIDSFKKSQIDFAVEINLKDIKKSLLFSEDGSIKGDGLGENKKSFFLDRNEIENWNSKKNIESFNKIINFWNSFNVSNFVFVNFEKMFNANEVFCSVTKDQLSELYKFVKKVNPNSKIILKSAFLSSLNITDCLSEVQKAGDYFIDTSYSLIGTNNLTTNDKLERFKPHKLFKKIEQSLEGDNTKTNIVMSLGSSLSGRIISRWGNEKSSNSFASKAFITVSLAGSFSSLIYYGDELGMLKTNIKNNASFNDIYVTERRRFLQSQGQKQKDFYKAQQYLSPINTQSLFQWDSSKNGGFSNGEVTIRQLSTTYKEINVANQYNDPDSSLFYLKKIIEFTKNPIYRHFFNNATTKVKYVSNGIIKYTHKVKEEKLYVFINVSKSWKKVSISDKLIVVLSNYSRKTYNHKIKMLAPFESLILFSKKDYNQ